MICILFRQDSVFILFPRLFLPTTILSYHNPDSLTSRGCFGRWKKKSHIGFSLDKYFTNESTGHSGGVGGDGGGEGVQAVL